MSLLAEFSLESPDLALAGALAAAPDVTVEVEQQMATGVEVPVLTGWAFGDDFDRFEAGLDDDDTVQSWTDLEALDDKRLYRVHLDPSDLVSVYPEYQRLGAVPLDASGSADGWQRKVRFPHRDAVVQMRSFCEECDISFRLYRLYAPGESDLADEFGLSSEQRRTLRTAQRIGYFEVPREVSLDELGERLDISDQSASERLRRGVSKLISNTLLSDF